MKKDYITPCTETFSLKVDTPLLGDSTYDNGSSVDNVQDGTEGPATDDDGWIINTAKGGFFEDEESWDQY